MNHNKQYMDCEDYIALFKSYGETDPDYLRKHYARFCDTQHLFYQNNPAFEGKRILDMGAHWLHQAVLYTQDGFTVTAADFPETIEKDSIKKLASEYNIDLFSYQDISTSDAFSHFPDNSFDVIIFTEFLEHITFNPVELWKSLYRILSPRGRIIITTPNYYYFPRRARAFMRMLSRMGGGLSVDQILNTHTYGHHWKEYSAREIKRYFETLSPDFAVRRLAYAHDFTQYRRSPPKFIVNAIPILFKCNIYADIELAFKDAGIVIDPCWSQAPKT